MKFWLLCASVFHLLCLEGSSGFSPQLFDDSSKVKASVHSNRVENDIMDNAPNRRNFLGSAMASLCLPAMVSVSLTSLPSSAGARDELFRPNPLTNPVLEQLRILEQAEKDTIQYKGELEKGNAGNKGKVDAYPSLLVPILKIDQELKEVRSLVRSGGDTKPSQEALSKALAILQQPTYEKINFKKTFNRYGDNIYYSDPDRANLYLGGGATPKTEQSIAYLLRNDVLTNLENLRAELEYLLKSGEDDMQDLYLFADTCTSSMQNYIDQVPPTELKEAQRILLSEQSS